MKTKRIVAVLLLVITAVLMTSCGRKQLDCQKLIAYEIEGVDGYGNIVFNFNKSGTSKNQFVKTYFPKESKNEALELTEQIYNSLEISADKTTDISNGDKIKVKVNATDEELLKECKITLINLEFEIEVKDLMEVQTIDAFTYVDVTFDGFETYGTSSFERNNKSSPSNAPEWSYEWKDGTATEDLSNGDEVTLVVKTLKTDEQLLFEGYKIIEREKTYTVSGLAPLTEIDPFENVKLAYEGASPFLKVKVDKSEGSETVIDNVSFKIDDGTDKKYKENDVINVTASVISTDKMKKEGYKLSVTEKEFTVTDCRKYLDTLDGYDLSVIEKDMEDAKEAQAVHRYVKNAFGNLSGLKLKKQYFLVRKDAYYDKYTDGYNEYNKYIKIYKATPEKKSLFYDDHEAIYIIVYASDLITDYNGDVTCDYPIYKNYNALEKNFEEVKANYITKYQDEFDIIEIPVE
ncbi:MAG: hypothetical protein ACI4JW_12020 [Oscillospiraceae bacterium]